METCVRPTVEMDPEKVFGAVSTDRLESIARTFRIKPSELITDRQWQTRFSVANGKDVKCLPKQCPSVSTTILIFIGNFRIDRYVVVKAGVVTCKYRPEYESRLEWGATSYGQLSISQPNCWKDESGLGISGDMSKTIVRIVIIPPKWQTEREWSRYSWTMRLAKMHFLLPLFLFLIARIYGKTTRTKSNSNPG